jgi:hypothetical protein
MRLMVKFLLFSSCHASRPHDACDSCRQPPSCSQNTRNVRVRKIVAQLELSEITAKAHHCQISRKMRTRSLVDLVRMADACWYAQHATNSAPGAYT